MITFLQQNNGKFSKRARQKEFQALAAPEALELEALFAEIFMDK